ncbi:Potassium channel [Tilletia horrida]|nr:Potassium channel [Tilletia horrida]
MPPIVPLVLATGVALRGLRERNRRLDAEEGIQDPEQEEREMRRELDDDDDDDLGDNDDTLHSDPSEQVAGQPGSSFGRPARRRASSRPSLDRRKSSVESAPRVANSNAPTSSTEASSASNLEVTPLTTRRRSSAARASRQHPEFDPSRETSSDSEREDEPQASDLRKREPITRRSSGSNPSASPHMPSPARRTSTENASQHRRSSAHSQRIRREPGRDLSPRTTTAAAVARDLGEQDVMDGSTSLRTVRQTPRFDEHPATENEGTEDAEGRAARMRSLTDSPVEMGSDTDGAEGFGTEPTRARARDDPAPRPTFISTESGDTVRARPVPIPVPAEPSARPSTKYSVHHWQRFYNLLHPNFLHHHAAAVPTPHSAGSDNEKDFPRTSTWTSEAASSDYGSTRHGQSSPSALMHRHKGAGRSVHHGGRGAGVSTQPAVSFQREVSVGGLLLPPQVPSILRSRTSHAGSVVSGAGAGGESLPPPTPNTPVSRLASHSNTLTPTRPGLGMRRTLTAESDMSASGYSDTDGETVLTAFSGEEGDEDDAADRIVGRSRKDTPNLIGRGRGLGRGRAGQVLRQPSRAFSTLLLAGGSTPLRGWARRKQERERDEGLGQVEADVEQGDGDGEGDEDVEGRGSGRRSSAATTPTTARTGNGEEDEEADSEDEGEARLQQYRKTPIVSGIMAPFSIMLEVPGFTSSWYISTGRDEGPVQYAKNPVLLDVGLAFSMAFAVIANLFIILRFLEVMRPRKSTLVAIVLLTLHDAINIAALAAFGKIHAIADGFTYSEGYWMTMGSTVASIIVNCTLVADFVNTKEFRNAGSGLSRKQRELVIMTMLVLFYLSLGALMYSFMLHQNFESALYFVVCTLCTIGFGDITPKSTVSRIILFIYAPVGIVLVALVIATTRETILEQFEQSYKKRREAVKARYMERQEAKRVNRQLRRAVRLRQVTIGRGGARQWLAENGQMLPNVDLALPVLLHNGQAKEVGEKKDSTLGKMLDVGRAFFETGFSRGWSKDKARKSSEEARPGGLARLNRPFGKCSPQDCEEKPHGHGHSSDPAPVDLGAGLAMSAAALVAPARAGTAFLSPRDTEWSEKGAHSPGHDGLVGVGTDSSNTGSETTQTDRQKSPSSPGPEGGAVEMAAQGGDRGSPADIDGEVAAAAAAAAAASGGGGGGGGGGGDHQDEMTLMEESLRRHRQELERHWEDFKHEVAQQERNEFVAKMVVSGSLFLIFWLTGAGVFVATEHWNFFEGLYFGFVFFSTIGYGDFSPTTPSGRAFFIVWALLGVGILTVIFSVLGDAWGTIYKSTLANTSRRNGWKARLRRRKQKQREQKQQQQQENGAGDDGTLVDANQDQQHRSGSIAGSLYEGSMRKLTRPLGGRRRQDSQGPVSDATAGQADDATTGTMRPEPVSVAPSESGDATDDGGGGGDASRPRMRRTDTMSSMPGAGADTSGEPITQPPKKRQRAQMAPDQIPLHLARAAMHLHSEASHLLEAQRHVLADAVSSAPSLHRRLRKQLRVVAAGGKLARGSVSVSAILGEEEGDGLMGAGAGATQQQQQQEGEGEGGEVDEDECHRRELEKLETVAVNALEREGDAAGVAAVRQLFALVHYDSHLSILIENSHILRDTLLNQERELAELKARVAELERNVEADVEDRLEDEDADEDADKDTDMDMDGTAAAAKSR